MKRAASTDLKRAIAKRTSRQCPIISRVSISRMPGFDDIDLQPNSGFIALCGGTGVGKSALLRAIYTATQPTGGSKTVIFEPRLGNMKINLRIESNLFIFDQILDGGQPFTGNEIGFEPECRLVTMYDRTDDLLAAFEGKDKAVLLEPYEPKRFDAHQIALVSRAVGKSYSEILVYEIDDEDNPDEIIPYFRATEAELTYDLDNMGTGELSAIYIAWIMKYIKDNSIVLLEEPEAMLPPSSHVGVFDIICDGALKKGAAVIISTHSAGIISELPAKQLIPLRRAQKTTRFPKSAEHKDQILRSLGLRLPTTGIVFVEDELALNVASEIISRYDLHLKRRIEIVNAGSGFGTIKLALENFPNIKSFKLAGLLDGDMREEAGKWKRSDICCFLPFETCMEDTFLRSIWSNVGLFSRLVGRSIEDVEVALSLANGQEPHDGFADFQREISVTYEQLAKHCVDHWTEFENVVSHCKALTEAIRAVLHIS